MVTAKSEETGYVPPFEVSAKAINLIAEISRKIERYAIRLEQEDGLRLRKANRIKTIHSSLAIEGNNLSEDLGITIRQCERILASLKEKGMIRRIGPNKGGHWEVGGGSTKG